MTTESKTKKANPDYSNSAVDLNNPPEVKAELNVFYQLQSEQAEIQVMLEKNELFIELQEVSKKLVEQRVKVVEAIDKFGSYQDIENGAYAIKQRKESIDYKPELVRQYAPSRVASFVLIESVDKKAMEAMVKTKQMTPEQARNCGEIQEAYAYIVKHS